MRLNHKLMLILLINLIALLFLGNYLKKNIFEVKKEIKIVTSDVKQLDHFIEDKISPIAFKVLPIYELVNKLITLLIETQTIFVKAIGSDQIVFLDELNEITDSFLENSQRLNEYHTKSLHLDVDQIETQYLYYVERTLELLNDQLSGEEVSVLEILKTEVSNEEITALLKSIHELIQTNLTNSLSQLISDSNQLNRNILGASKTADSKVEKTDQLIGFAFILFILLSILFTYLLVHFILDPIRALQLQIGKITQGDFSKDEVISVESLKSAQLLLRQDELGVLARDVETLRQSFSDTFQSDHIDWVDMARTVAMVNNSSLASFFVNSSGTIQYFNDQAATLLKQFFETIPGRFNDVQNSNIFNYHTRTDFVLETIKNDKNLPFEAIVEIAQEKVELKISSIYDLSHEYIGAMVTWQIITDKVNDQDKMSRIVSMVENSPISILSANLDGKIDYMNPRAYQQLKRMGQHLEISIDRVIGSDYGIFHKNPEHQRSILSDPSNLPFHSKISLYGELVSLKVNAIYDQDEIYIGVMIIWDSISKELEEKNKELENLLVVSEEAVMAKSSFLSNMSHELRTPLNGIIGFTEMLLDDRLNDDQEESLSTIRVCSNNLLSLVNDILDFNKLESNQIFLSYYPIDLEELLYECNETLRPNIEGKSLELLVKVDNKLAKVHCDPIRIAQILSNLLSNAIKFTQTGDVITQINTLWQDDDKITLRISVKDTGIGIAPKNHHKIFQMFQQADNSSIRKYGGKGLGLSITKRLLEMMGSDLQISSKINEGCEFYFDLDLKKHHETTELDEIILNEEDFENKTVLLVDDNLTSLLILEKFCKQLKMKCFKAEGCMGALEIIHSEHPDLILLDIRMPLHDGFYLFDELKKLQIDIKIIAVTGDVSMHTSLKIAKRSFSACLLKPVRKTALLLEMAKAFDISYNLPYDNIKSSKAHYIDLRPSDILVVEDCETNQKMIVKML
ncbi:ATP-binding protein, partial [bacterium]|nr:ATP-binding protein [bacterium]